MLIDESAARDAQDADGTNAVASSRGMRVRTLGRLKPQWGGYLNLFDWDIEQAFRPRFNSLNLFQVPQCHSVGEVLAEAPLARYAVTGWARDR